MGKSTSVMMLIAVATLLSVIVIVEPEWLCDKKPFIKEFMSKDILSVLGIILTITLASAAQLHLEFNKIEEAANKRFLINSRRKVHQAAYALIYAFVFACILLIIKPIIADPLSDRSQSAVNAIGIYVLFINVLILIELTQAAFSIMPHVDE
jgi:hypothetical protein